MVEKFKLFDDNEIIKISKYPEPEAWSALMTRAAESTAQLEQTVAEIISQVRERGDEALREYASRFDGVELSDIEIAANSLVNMCLIGRCPRAFLPHKRELLNEAEQE